MNIINVFFNLIIPSTWFCFVKDMSIYILKSKYEEKKVDVLEYKILRSNAN